MSIHPLAGKIAPPELLIDVDAVIAAFWDRPWNPFDPGERVSFGTSGHRGTSLHGSFNLPHILAMSQAVAEYRRSAGIDGPLYIGIDTHALSKPALEVCLEVLLANGCEVFAQSAGGFTPTPVISHSILAYNRGRQGGWADGIVITPSHNPPEDGGFKYNPPHGGPAGSQVTAAIESRANALLSNGNAGVARMTGSAARASPHLHAHDFVSPYIESLREVVDMEAIRAAGLRLAADPLGGASVGYWARIAETYGLDLTVVNSRVDPTFSFMCVDKDGKIRMDCSSRYAMAGLLELKDRFDLAFGNDTDADRHGIVTPTAGLMNPNHYLSVVIDYLFNNRPTWSPSVAIGKTLVSSSLIDRVAAGLGRRVCETPVGFKWFVDGLLSGLFGFAGEESAGASLLRRDGSAWTTDKDGIALCLLAAEIRARTGRDPGELYRDLTARFGDPVYDRLDAPVDLKTRDALKKISAAGVRLESLAGEPVLAKLTEAPGNGEPIGGLKVTTENGWFAIRPSGTENIYKIYAESFKGEAHLREIQAGARDVVARLKA